MRRRRMLRSPGGVTFVVVLTMLLYASSASWGMPNAVKHARYGGSGYQDVIVVKFRSNVSEDKILAFNRNSGAIILRRLKWINGVYILRLPKHVRAARMIEYYRESGIVEYAEPNYIFRIQYIPDDPMTKDMWNIDAIDAFKVWDIENGTSDIVVAVIDTGGDISHEDLSSNIWINPWEVCGDGIDNDGNGYVDDCHGVNVLEGSGDVRDDNGHGTHVAGIIGAVGNNGIGIAGVNWNISIMPIKAFDRYGYGTLAGLLQSFDYILEMRSRGVNIVATSNSYTGDTYSKAMYDAIVALMKAGVLFIAAAGNGGRNLDMVEVYPASYDIPSIISVASVDESLNISGFSNYGPHTVDIAAPGEEVLSTLPGDRYGTLSGTSMAVPHAAGLAALLKAYNSSLEWWQIKNLIIAGGYEKGSLAGKVLSGRVVNAYGAITCSSSPLLAVEKPEVGYVEPGRPLVLRATSLNCSSPVHVRAEVVKEDGTTYTVPLHDDGAYPDTAAGDGSFAAIWTPAADGRYGIVFTNGILRREVWISVGSRRTLVVGSEACTQGDAYYTTIQQAVKEASPWDRVVVCPGLYQGPVRVDKPLEIAGYPEKDEDVQVTGKPWDWTVLEIRSSNVNVSGLTIKGEWNGIYVLSSEYAELSNNTVYGGISVYNSGNVAISGNHIKNGRYGISIVDSSLVNIFNNEVYKSMTGAEIKHSSGVKMRNNTIEECNINFGIYGNAPEHFANDIDTSNRINGKPVLYLVGVKNIIVDASTNAGFVGVINSKNVSVIGLGITNNSHGVLVAYSDGIKIKNVTSTHNVYGIQLISSYNSVIGDNLIYRNSAYGINLYNSGLNDIYGNIVNKNSIGVHIENSIRNRVVSNEVFDNYAFDMYVSAESAEHCSNLVESNVGSGNRSIVYLKGWRNISDGSYSEMILCDSDNSVIKDVSVSGSDKFRNNGILVIMTDNSTLYNITSIKNRVGVYMDGSIGNKVYRSRFSDNFFGISLRYSKANVIYGNEITYNRLSGVLLWGSNNNTINTNLMHMNGGEYGYGVLIGSSWENLLFNNMLNNSQNVKIMDGESANLWSVEVRPGISITGGEYIGGNYWGSPSGDGYSDTCNDADDDGICDLPNIINGKNIDYAPLAGSRMAMGEMPGYSAIFAVFASFLPVLWMRRRFAPYGRW